MSKAPMLDEILMPLWAQTRTGLILHVVHSADADPDDEWWTQGDGVTLCGIASHLSYPGIFSRMGCQRCVRCCRALGIPAGKGHPKNDDDCRRILGYGPAPTMAEIKAAFEAQLAGQP